MTTHDINAIRRASLRFSNGRRLLTGLFIGLICTVAEAQSPPRQNPQVQPHLARAREALKANAADTAVKEYRAVLDLEPGNIEAQSNLGVIAFFQGDYKSASQYFEGALASQPSLPKAQALLGICKKRLGDPAAQALLEKAFSELTDPKLRVQTGLELAGLYHQQGNLRRAAPLMQSLTELDPENVDVLYSAQLLYTELADETLNKMAVLAPGSGRMQQVIAERLVNAGDLKGAIQHYRKALELDQRLPGIRYELSQAIFESSQSDPKARAEARGLLESAVKIEGDNAKLECELGAIARSEPDDERAIAHYEQALALNPKEVEAQMGLARLWIAKRKPEEAVRYLRMAVETDPLNAEAHYRLARVYRDLHRDDEAQRELRLFQDIKKTKETIKELYKQMNKETKTDEGELQIAK
jgi:tetratricopeptide (TPR) repeat protein